MSKTMVRPKKMHQEGFKRGLPANLSRVPERESMGCPECGNTKNVVIDSRPYVSHIRRRRVCGGCGLRFSTEERCVSIPPFVLDFQI